jgi:hypothetical protein
LAANDLWRKIPPDGHVRQLVSKWRLNGCLFSTLAVPFRLFIEMRLETDKAKLEAFMKALGSRVRGAQVRGHLPDLTGFYPLGAFSWIKPPIPGGQK